MCAFIPKCHWLPFLVWCISGSRSPSAFLVELGAAMIVASTMLPRLSSRPLRARCAFTRLRISGASSFSSSRCRKFRIVVSSGIGLVSVRPRERAHRRDLVERLFHRRVAQPEPVLHQVHPQHRLQRVGLTAAARHRIERLDQIQQRLPRHHLLHLGQEHFAPRLLALARVLRVPKAHLTHRSLSCCLQLTNQTTIHGDLFRLSLDAAREL